MECGWLRDTARTSSGTKLQSTAKVVMTGGFLQDDRVAIFHCETLLRDRFDFCSLFYRSDDSVTCIFGDTSEGKSQTAHRSQHEDLEKWELVGTKGFNPPTLVPKLSEGLKSFVNSDFRVL